MADFEAKVAFIDDSHVVYTAAHGVSYPSASYSTTSRRGSSSALTTGSALKIRSTSGRTSSFSAEFSTRFCCQRRLQRAVTSPICGTCSKPSTRSSPDRRPT